MELNYDLKWMEETVHEFDRNNWIYKLACLLLFKPRKKLTYNEVYLLLRGLNESHLPKKEADIRAYAQVCRLYYYNNKNMNTTK